MDTLNGAEKNPASRGRGTSNGYSRPNHLELTDCSPMSMFPDDLSFSDVTVGSSLMSPLSVGRELELPDSSAAIDTDDSGDEDDDDDSDLSVQ